MGGPNMGAGTASERKRDFFGSLLRLLVGERLMYRDRPARVFGLLVWLAVTFTVAAIGALASVDAATFYEQLQRPSWAPPSWLFGPVWTVLYAAMAVSAWLVWRKRGFGEGRVALGLFLLQLAVNGLWSWLFFGWRLGGLALADVLLLWMLIALTMVVFHGINRLAALLLVPYLAWVTFASALTFAVWRLNPALLG
jgi:benzodiazapine receptor